MKLVYIQNLDPQQLTVLTTTTGIESGVGLI